MTAKTNQPTLTAIPRDASKAEEIQWIETAAKLATANSGTHLADLFTGRMVTWVTEQIKNDFPPDLYGHMIQADKDAAETSSKLRGEIDRLTAELSRHFKQNKDVMDALQRETDAANELAETRRIQRDHEMERGKLLVADNDELVRNLEDANEEIRRLKLMIFDMEHPRPARA